MREMNAIPPETLVSQIGERELLSQIAPYVAASSPAIVTGFGDDCAAVRSAQDGGLLLLSTDMLAEGTHFLRNPATDWRRLGAKAVTANVSDIAAMGGMPEHLLVSLGLPGSVKLGEVLDLYRGMHAEASRWGAALVGGDTVSSPVLVINIAITGRVEAGANTSLRSGCRPGQNVYASGTLGDSRAGLHLLLNGKYGREREQPYAAALLERHLQPEPRVPLGRALAAFCPDIAMIDISDSLYNELHILAGASGTGFRIETHEIPISPELRAFCRDTAEEPLDYALFSGEEYELLFTSNTTEAELRTFLRQKGVTTPVHRIGLVTPAPEIGFFGQDGNRLAMHDQTFRHFGER